MSGYAIRLPRRGASPTTHFAANLTATAMALLLSLASITGCATGDASTDEETGTTPPTVGAQTQLVDTTTFTEVAEAVGMVTARLGHAASLSAPAATRITRVRVAVGDRVDAGAALVDFESVLFDATFASADAALTAATKAAARAERLVAAGVAPRRDAELAAAELAAAQSTAMAARRIQQLATLRSPIAGVVTGVSAVMGANVDVGQPLVDVADPTQLDVMLQLAPAMAAQVRTGQTVMLAQNARVRSEPMGAGVVADVAAVVDSGSQSVTVRVSLRTTTRTLRIGETVSGRITTGRHPGAVVVPDDALVPFDEGFRVFVVDSAQVAHARRVTIGGRSGQVVWITAGIRAGERVVTAGAYGLDDGSTVVAMPAGRARAP